MIFFLLFVCVALCALQCTASFGATPSWWWCSAPCGKTGVYVLLLNQFFFFFWFCSFPALRSAATRNEFCRRAEQRRVQRRGEEKQRNKIKSQAEVESRAKKRKLRQKHTLFTLLGSSHPHFHPFAPRIIHTGVHRRTVKAVHAYTSTHNKGSTPCTRHRRIVKVSSRSVSVATPRVSPRCGVSSKRRRSRYPQAQELRHCPWNRPRTFTRQQTVT